MLHCLASKHICQAFSTVKCDCVCEWITRAILQFLICLYNILTPGTAMIFQVFDLFIQEIA